MSIRIRPFTRHEAIPFAAMLAVICAIVTMSGCAKKAPPVAEPPAINVVKIAASDVPIYDEFVGQTDAPQNVEIRVRVEGYVDKIAFTEGSYVSSGTLLYQLDPRPYQAALEITKADLAKANAELQRARESVNLIRAKANLVADEAELVNANQNLARVAPLASQRAVTQAQLDAATARQKEAQAKVDAGRAVVTQTELTQKTDIDAAIAVVDANKASVRNAELNLAYTTVRAPISGRISRSAVEIGSLAQTGRPEPLTVISTTDEIFVNFSVTERQYIQFSEKLSQIETAEKNRTGQLEMVLADGTVYPDRGRVNLTDTSVNPETGTLGLRAVFPNRNGIVKPGQFAKIRAVVEQATGVIVVPAQAVQDLLGARFVYVVNDENIIVRRDVVPGAQLGRLWVIEKGLTAGERVVVDGLQKVRPELKVNPTVVPLETASPDATKAPAT